MESAEVVVIAEIAIFRRRTVSVRNTGWGTFVGVVAAVAAKALRAVPINNAFNTLIIAGVTKLSWVTVVTCAAIDIPNWTIELVIPKA